MSPFDRFMSLFSAGVTLGLCIDNSKQKSQLKQQSEFVEGTRSAMSKIIEENRQLQQELRKAKDTIAELTKKKLNDNDGWDEDRFGSHP